jgi:dCMP deaminase
MATEMKKKFVDLYMGIANEVSKMSASRRTQVGAVAVKDHRILSIGYNGTLPGADNNCETAEFLLADKWTSKWISEEEALDYWDNPYVEAHFRLTTKPEVVHAEANCLLKMARDGQPSLGADIFLTLTPCVECAKMMKVAGIRKVWFRDEYRDLSGVEFLKSQGIEVEQVKKEI